MPAKVPPIETVRNCKSADGCLSATNDDSGIVRGVQVGRAGGVASARTPSSPALSRISAGGDRGCSDAGDDDDNDGRGTPVDDEKPGRPGRRHGDAQRHHGLPDAIEDAVYRSLQTKRHKHPGLGLNGCWPKCSAVAYKSFNDPGPTQCSKLRVYRPKTSSSTAAAADREKDESTRLRACCGGGDGSRPKTCVPVMTADQLTDIKLALCWDLDAPFDRNRPPDEPAVFHKVRQQQQPPCGGANGGEPRKPQNSSAVMGFVAAAGNGDVDDSRAVAVPESRRAQTRECLLRNRNLSAVMELIPNKAEAAERNDDVTAAADRTVPDKPSSSSTVRRRSASSTRSRDEAKSNDDHRYAPDNDDGKRHEVDDDGGGGEVAAGSDDARPSRARRSSPAAGHSTGRPRHRGRRHQDAGRDAAIKSDPLQRRHACRPCLACDHLAAAGRRDPHEECDHYKMAFKAGVPVSTPVKHRAAAAGKPAKHLKVPKPRTTNSDKKKYVIGTLLPPFSMWPGTTARDYPEHWRLTSVYRQAFKPLELRKQPLLQTIYL